MGHDGPMPASTGTQALPPLVCRDFTSWHLTGARFVTAHISDDGTYWEVLHHGPRFERRLGVWAERVDAEADAQAHAIVLAVTP